MNLRIKKKKKKNTKVPQQTAIGIVVDLPLKEFEEELVRQKVNIGTINNLILNLEAIYYELRMRKDAILKMSFDGTIEKDKANSAVNGLYAEMIKVEQKVTYLKQRRQELINVG